MQVSNDGYQAPPATAQDVSIDPQTNGHGPCPVCKQHLTELKLGPFIKHRQQCKGDIHQREISHLPPGRRTGKNSPPGIKRHSCPFCAKAFGQTNHLKAHLRIHTGEKPYDCEQCNKQFAQKSDLTKHKRIHTGERPYECEQCRKCFALTTTLQNHRLTHTGEKPFECKQCNKRFIQKNHLTGHQRSHTGERPFKCTLCSKAFTYNCSLKIHMRKHQEKPSPSGDPALV